MGRYFMTKIVVYTQPGCGKCRATERLLELHKTPFDTVDIREKPEYINILTAHGYRETPVVFVKNDDGTIADEWCGFHPEKIKEYV
jgi:glutaredoxin